MIINRCGTRVKSDIADTFVGLANADTAAR
jgi:hypothetical protein